MNDEVDRPLVSPDDRPRQELRVDRVKRADQLLLAPASHEHVVDLEFRQVTTASPTMMRIFQAKRLHAGLAPRAGRKVCELVRPSFLHGRLLRQRLRPRLDVVLLGQQFRPPHLLVFQLDFLQTTDAVRHQVRLCSAQPPPGRRASRHCRHCPPARRDHYDGVQERSPWCPSRQPASSSAAKLKIGAFTDVTSKRTFIASLPTM